MPKSSIIQTSFNAGEWSPLLASHINLDRWGSSCQLIQNLIPLKQGALVRRGGTKFIKEVKDSSSATALIPFEFNVEQAYQIEVGDSYFRFFTDNSVITETAQSVTNITQSDPAVLTYTGSDPSNGDEVYIDSVSGMTEVNGKFFLVSNVNAGAKTFELADIDGNDIDSTGYTAYSSGGTIAIVYEVASPYSASDLFDSDLLPKYQYAQSADVMFIAHQDYNVRSLSRLGNADWSVTDIEFNDGPYLEKNSTTTTLALSGTTGSVTVTASATEGINSGDGFVSTDVGRLIRWKDSSNDWTWLKITAYTSSTQVTATIKGDNASATTATTEWRLGVYSETTGYPKVVTFFQDRIFLAGCTAYPDRWDLSRTGGYSADKFFFAPSDADGTVTDDASISGTLASGKVNIIQWAGSDDRGLVIGTAGREWILRPSTNNEVLTPENSKADPFSSIGSCAMQPVQVENATIFVQRSRKKVFDIIYSFQSDQLKPRDLSITAEHITRTGVAEISFQQEPINCIWARLTNGELRGLTYYPDEGVFGWHRHSLGGDGDVRSIVTTPSSDGLRDELTLIVERTINGVTRKYIEYMTPYYEDDINKEDAFHVDCGLTYDGASVSTISGLDHLEGETVKVMLDGNSHPDLTVTNGSITLANNRSGEKIQIGLPNTWVLKTQKMEGGSADGTSHGKTKRITNITLSLLNTLGLYYGTSADDLDEYDFNQGSQYNEDLALFTGHTEFLPFPNGYDQDAVIYLSHDGVFPACIRAIMPQIVTQDR